MKTVQTISGIQLSVGWTLLPVLVMFMSRGDSASDGSLMSQASSSSSRHQHLDDDLSSLPANCTPRQVLRHTQR